MKKTRILRLKIVNIWKCNLSAFTPFNQNNKTKETLKLIKVFGPNLRSMISVQIILIYHHNKNGNNTYFLFTNKSSTQQATTQKAVNEKFWADDFHFKFLVDFPQRHLCLILTKVSNINWNIFSLNYSMITIFEVDKSPSFRSSKVTTHYR